MHTTKLASLLEVLEALEGTDTAAWAWDLGTESIRWSANTGPLFGRERAYQPASFASVLEEVHPSDRHAVSQAIDTAIARKGDFEIEFRTTRSADSVRWLMSRGHVVVDEAGRARRLVGVVTDVTSRRRRAEQDRFLATAVELLSQSLSIKETLTRITALVVDGISDWCVVQLLDVDQPPAVSHRDPDRVALARRLQQEYPPNPEPVGVGAMAVDSGRAVLIEVVTDEMLVEIAVDERHLEILRSLGLRSVIVAPLVGRGRVVGLMTLISAETPYRFGPQDVEFAEDFGRRAGIAIDNARLWEEAEKARVAAQSTADRLTVLQDLIAELSRASSVGAVGRAAVERSAEATNANRGAVVLSTDDGPVIAASRGYTPERLEAMEPSLRQPGPLTDAMSKGAVVYCETVTELLERYPNLAEVMAPVPYGAFAALPLYGAKALLGAIGFVFVNDHVFSEQERRLLASIAQHVGVAMERARMFDRINTVADTLQAALAPPVEVSTGGVVASAFYRPAGVGSVGGDWYDVAPTPRGTHMYVVGDVVGRGLEAVAAMAQLRQSTRLLISEGRSPAGVLSALAQFAATDHSFLASTMLCAEVDADAGRVTLASAGHLPPIMVGHGLAAPVEVPLGPPLGVGSRQAEDHLIDLAGDHCLVMYTDGVIERRDRDIDSSLRGMCERLRSIPADVHLIAQDLLKLADEADDDATILVFSLTGDACFGPSQPGSEDTRTVSTAGRQSGGSVGATGA